MAMQLQAEGTGYSGENEPTDMDTFLSQHRVSEDTIQKLKENELDTIDHLKSIEIHDIDELCTECGIKVTQKIKLKTAIKKLKDTKPIPVQPSHLPPVLIDKEERIALTKMAEKIKAIEGSINLVAETTKNIDTQVANHMSSIKSTFKELHQSLDQRQEVLVAKLNTIANEKKQKLQNTSNTLNQQHNASKQKLYDCTKRVSKPIEIHEINTRIKEITAISNEVNDIKLINKDDSVIGNNKINITLNKNLVNTTINSFGNLSSGVIPILISLKDNKDGTVGIEWKLDQKDELKNNETKKLKVEWSESKSDNIEQLDQKWEYNKQIDLNDNNKTISVKVANIPANYFFQILYFDGDSWSSKSNIKYVKVETLTDCWDPNCKYKSLQISGNSIINTDSSQTSAYMTRIASTGIHCWKVRIDKYYGGWSLLGVWKTKFDPIIANYFEANLNQSYAFVIYESNPDGYLSDPTKRGSNGRKYGRKIKNGDVIEMTLNMNDCTLSYKIGDTDYGKAFDVEKTSYKAAATVYYKDSKFTLLSYSYRP